MIRHRVEWVAWIAGVIGLAGSIAGWLIDPQAFAYALLAALILAIGWPLGSLALIHVHALTGGEWGYAIRQQLAFGIAALAIVLPAIIPIPFLAPLLYPWMHTDNTHGLLNLWYLNPGFFYGRGIVYGIIWLAIGGLTLLALRRTDPEPMLYRISPGCLILLALSVTFAAVNFHSFARTGIQVERLRHADVRRRRAVRVVACRAWGPSGGPARSKATRGPRETDAGPDYLLGLSRFHADPDRLELGSARGGRMVSSSDQLRLGLDRRPDRTFTFLPAVLRSALAADAAVAASTRYHGCDAGRCGDPASLVARSAVVAARLQLDRCRSHAGRGRLGNGGAP